MKTVAKMFGIIALAAVIVLSMTTCGDSQKSGEESSYVIGTLKITNEQVYKRTGNNTISEAYEEFTGTYHLKIVTINETEVGTGEIVDGSLTFGISSPGIENLIGWDELKDLFSNWKDLTASNLTVKGNMITLITSSDEETDKKVLREKLYGTVTKSGLEKVMYIYVNKSCNIKGDYNTGSDNGNNWHTPTILDLPLKEGWNLVCRRDYTDNEGKNAITMELRQPIGFKWVIDD